MDERKGRTKKGFTLVEMMIGSVLFATALFGLMFVIGESLALGKAAENRTIALNESRRVLEEIRNVANTSGLATVASTNWTTWATANLSNTLANESTAVTDLNGNALVNNADPLPVRVTTNWTEKGKTTVYTVDTLVTQR